MLKSYGKERREYLKILLRPIEGASPEDFMEYDYEDVKA